MSDGLPTTRRTRLRRVAPADAPVLMAVLGDPEVMRFSVSGPMDCGAVAVTIDRWQEAERCRGFGFWIIEHRPTGALIGYCGLSHQVIDGEPFIELGYRLARSWWGQGLATETAAAVRDHAFTALGLPELIAIIEPENCASIRVAEKLGMSFMKSAVYYGRPVLIYHILRQPER